MSDPQRELTYGEKAVGLTFNPSGDTKVQKLKELYAQIIDICYEGFEMVLSSESSRLYSIAIEHAQSAQMWSVKAATWRD